MDIFCCINVYYIFIIYYICGEIKWRSAMTFKLFKNAQDLSWFHFRKNFGSLLESFTISYLFDGTVAMTGDYGCLAWQRKWFPKPPDTPDYGFPYNGTGIGYFGEKVCRANGEQVIRTWSLEKAKHSIRGTIDDYRSADCDDMIIIYSKLLEDMDYIYEDGDHGQRKFFDLISDDHPEIHECYDVGICYTESFISKYNMLSSVSDIIINTVKENEAHN